MVAGGGALPSLTIRNGSNGAEIITYTCNPAEPTA